MPEPEASTSLDDKFRVLSCLIEGDSTLQVKLSVDNNVFDLKDHILEKGFHVGQHILAKDLVLWKVNASLVVKRLWLTLPARSPYRFQTLTHSQ